MQPRCPPRQKAPKASGRWRPALPQVILLLLGRRRRDRRSLSLLRNRMGRPRNLASGTKKGKGAGEARSVVSCMTGTPYQRVNEVKGAWLVVERGTERMLVPPLAVRPRLSVTTEQAQPKQPGVMQMRRVNWIEEGPNGRSRRSA